MAIAEANSISSTGIKGTSAASSSPDDLLTTTIFNTSLALLPIFLLLTVHKVEVIERLKIKD